MALEGSGTTMAASSWLSRADTAPHNKTDIRSIAVHNPTVMGSTASSTSWIPLHAGNTLQAGVRLKVHGGGSNSVFVAVDGATGAETSTETMGYELRPGEEVFLEVNNLNAVSHYSSGGTLSYMGN